MEAAPLILRLILSVAYVVVGTFVLIYRPFHSAVFDLAFALACFGYGIFRGYRAWQIYSENKDEQP